VTRRIHRWLGTAIAAWLAAVALSGMLLLFEDEYYGWRYPTLPGPSAPACAADGGTLARIAGRAAGTISTIGMPTSSLCAYRVWRAEGGQALHHPADGSPVATWHGLDSLPGFLFELHAHLLLGDAGHQLVGALALAALLNLLLGFVLWWRRRAIFRLRDAVPRRARRPSFLRAHAAQGTVLGLAFIVSLVSGAALVFDGPAQTLLNRALGTNSVARPAPDLAAASHAPVNWAAVLAASQRAFPDGELRFAMPPAEPGRPVTLRVRNRGELHPNGRSYLVVEPSSGAVLERIDATGTGAGPAVFNALYPIHAGKTGWPGYRALLVVVSASFLYVALSGAWLYLARPRRRTEQHCGPPVPADGR
jgi:uncharacterized iron-regulated membrane protein